MRPNATVINPKPSTWIDLRPALSINRIARTYQARQIPRRSPAVAACCPAGRSWAKQSKDLRCGNGITIVGEVEREPAQRRPEQPPAHSRVAQEGPKRHCCVEGKWSGLTAVALDQMAR